MDPVYLTEVEPVAKAGPSGPDLKAMEAQGIPVPQILYLFGYKPEVTRHLAAFTQAAMRGPSPLSSGQRELIAALTSSRNHCLF